MISDLQLAPSVAAGVQSRVPGRASPRMALAAGALAVLLFAAWEGSLVAAGIKPETLPGELDLWLENYRRIGPDSVVFVGSSRTQQDISPGAVAEVLGIPHQRVVNLGISAGPGLPMLEHFAAREDFRGTLVVEILPTHDFGGEPSPMQNACLALLTPPQIYSDTELAMHRAWATNLRTARNDSTPLAVARSVPWRLRGETMPSTQIAQTLHPDRWREILIPPRDAEEAARVALTVAPDFEVWGDPPNINEEAEIIARYQSALGVLEGRGVVVILARLPSGFAVLDAEERRFPREESWVLLKLRKPHYTVCWHFADDPAASQLQTFDGSHLRGEDAVVFSRIVAELLKERMQKKEVR